MGRWYGLRWESRNLRFGGKGLTWYPFLRWYVKLKDRNRLDCTLSTSGKESAVSRSTQSYDTCIAAGVFLDLRPTYYILLSLLWAIGGNPSNIGLACS